MKGLLRKFELEDQVVTTDNEVELTEQVAEDEVVVNDTISEINEDLGEANEVVEAAETTETFIEAVEKFGCTEEIVFMMKKLHVGQLLSNVNNDNVITSNESHYTMNSAEVLESLNKLKLTLRASHEGIMSKIKEKFSKLGKSLVDLATGRAFKIKKQLEYVEKMDDETIKTKLNESFGGKDIISPKNGKAILALADKVFKLGVKYVNDAASGKSVDSTASAIVDAHKQVKERKFFESCSELSKCGYKDKATVVGAFKATIDYEDTIKSKVKELDSALVKHGANMSNENWDIVITAIGAIEDIEGSMWASCKSLYKQLR